jgi:hypothetical protein
MPPPSYAECDVIDLAERRRARTSRDVGGAPGGRSGDFWAAAAAVGWLLAFLLGLALFDGRVRAAEPPADPPVLLD